MKIEKERKTIIYTTFTKDEWMAIIAAIHMSTDEGLIQFYGRDLSSDMIEKLNCTQEKLASELQTKYGYELSKDILQYIEKEY